MNGSFKDAIRDDNIFYDVDVEENHGDDDKHNDHDVDNYADDNDGDVVVDGDDADDVNDDDNYDEEDNRLAVKLLHLLRTPCWLARFVFTN